VGIGGTTLGGGFGYLSRRYGLSCDNLLSADVVTADGRFLTARPDRHPDLFWALRGGGGNFGVVTSFEFGLHPVGTVLGGPIYYPAAAAREVLALFRDVMATAPEEVGGFFWFCRLPAVPFVPADRHGESVCMVAICCVGDQDSGRETIGPLLSFGPPLGHRIAPVPYPVLQRGFDPAPSTRCRRYWRGEFIRDLGADVLEVHAEYGPQVPAASTVHVSHLDGAAGRVSPGATAFSYRDGVYPTLIAAVYADPAIEPAAMSWAQEYWAALRPHSAGGAYVNFLMDEGRDRVVEAYGDNYPRLTAVKAEYDPENLFRMNQNVRPTR
jgi:FAD/FMN-containing dehydrogenase